MTSFKLTAGGTDYTLGLDGSVAIAAGAFGTWTTDGKKTNQIILKKAADGSTVPIDVKWSFNASNQLCLAQGANPVFNFTVAKVHPRFRMDSGNKLHVTPSPAGALFEFPLVCGFSLTKDTNLEITINGQKSTITGIPTSNKAYFGYSFLDKDSPIPQVILAFTGEWAKASADPAAQQIGLIFKFTVDADAFQFAMPPGSATSVSPQNHLFVTGVKNGQGWGVTIDGALDLRKDDKDFSLVFTLSQQYTAAGVKDTTLEVKAVFSPDERTNLNGYLDLYVGQSDNSGKIDKTKSQRLTVKGGGHWALGKNGLDVTFACASTQTSGQPSVVAVMVGATFGWDSGDLTVTYDKDGGPQTFKLSSNFTLNSTLRGQAYLNVTKDGKKVGVYGALGLSW